MATGRLLDMPARVLPQLLLVIPPLTGPDGDDFRHRLDEIIDRAPRSAHIEASAATTSMLMAP